MARITTTIQHPEGLHARPATLFSKQAALYKSTIMIYKPDGKKGNAKSILSVLSLGIDTGSQIDIEAVGADEEEAIQGLVKCLKELSEEVK